jgi:phage terminase Nu1 subunit (DNA packaging protein)
MASKGKGQTCNRGELSEFFGVTPPTVDAWVRAGCPIASKGQRGVASTFNTAEVANWLRIKAREEGSGTATADESELKRRKLAAETATAELTLARARDLVAPLDQVERMVSRAFAEVRAGMRNIPSRVVATLIGELDERQFKKVLLEEIDQVLEALSNADLSASDDDNDEQDDN